MLSLLDTGLPSTHTKEEYAAIRQHAEDCQIAQLKVKAKSLKTSYTEKRMEIGLKDWWDEIDRLRKMRPGDEGYDKDLTKTAIQEYNKVQLRFINNNQLTENGDVTVNIINYTDQDTRLQQIPLTETIEGEIINQEENADTNSLSV